MTILAATGFNGLAALLIVLACPLMMIFMMRGHGSHRAGASGDTNDTHPDQSEKSLDELKHERGLLNEEIGERAERTGVQ